IVHYTSEFEMEDGQSRKWLCARAGAQRHSTRDEDVGHGDTSCLAAVLPVGFPDITLRTNDPAPKLRRITPVGQISLLSANRDGRHFRCINSSPETGIPVQ